MNPPTEQLIRDYLNRLSVAARGKLGFSDRKSLLDRTRTRIEAECSGVNNVSAVQVRRVLASLGDPVAIVEVEQALVSARVSREPGEAGETGGGAVTAVDETEAAVGSALEVPPPDLPSPDLPSPDVPAQAAPARLVKPVNGSARAAGAGLQLQAGPAALSVPEQPGEPGEHKQHGELELLAAPEPRGEPEPDDESVPGLRRISASPESGRGTTRRAPGSPGIAGRGSPAERQRLSKVASPLAGAATWVTAIVRRNPLEAIAVALLGVGGAVYPPIWLIGVVLVLPSRKWSIRDKSIGIMVPILLVIVGTVLILVLGGQQNSLSSYAYEAWLGAERLSRAAVLGGGLYLFWALRRGRRKPKDPPWLRRRTG
jgi:hypothetical protein